MNTFRDGDKADDIWITVQVKKMKFFIVLAI